MTDLKLADQILQIAGTIERLERERNGGGKGGAISGEIADLRDISRQLAQRDAIDKAIQTMCAAAAALKETPWQEPYSYDLCDAADLLREVCK